MKLVTVEGVEFLPIEYDHFSMWMDRTYKVYYSTMNTYYQNQRVFIYTKWLENWRSETRLGHQDIAKIINDSIPQPIFNEYEKTLKTHE